MNPAPHNLRFSKRAPAAPASRGGVSFPFALQKQTKLRQNNHRLAAQLRWIQSPNRKAQGCSKGYPDHIWEEQNAGQRARPPEGDSSAYHQNPENKNLAKRQRSVVPTEEEPAPKSVSQQLKNKQPKRPTGFFRSPLSPYKPGSDAHEQIEAAPHGSKNRCRWRPPGAHELLVKNIGVARTQRSDSSRGKRKNKPGGKADEIGHYRAASH